MNKYTILLTFAMFLASAAPAQKWTNYTMKNSEITGNNILAVATDNRGTLWVGTTQGLNSYRDGRWVDYSDFNEKLKNQFVSMLTG